MSPAAHGWTRWERLTVAGVTDGDTLRGWRLRSQPVGDTLMQVITDDPDVVPRGVALRLVHLNTPERGADGWAQARDDTAAWLDEHAGDLAVHTAPGGGFDRFLADVHVASDPARTLSLHMLAERGWPPYVRGA